jgi:hypothetical protein
MKSSTQFSARSMPYAGSGQLRSGAITIVRRIACCALLAVYCALAACGEKPGEPVKNDSVKENPLMQNLSDSEREELRKLLAAVPIPFEIMNKVSGAGLPYRKELLNPETNVSRYNTAEGQALNIGVYGSDMAYMIAFERLGESGAYLKSVRELTDAVVIPTVFDEASMKRYQVSSDQHDSVQNMMYNSYTRIDSTLQSNERFGLAVLVVTGGWIESLYLTTQQLNGEAKNDTNQLLYQMLGEQQKHTDDIISMLAMFPDDSLFVELHEGVSAYKKLSSPATEYTPDELAAATTQLAALRAKLISIE